MLSQQYQCVLRVNTAQSIEYRLHHQRHCVTDPRCYQQQGWEREVHLAMLWAARFTLLNDWSRASVSCVLLCAVRLNFAALSDKPISVPRQMISATSEVTVST